MKCLSDLYYRIGHWFTVLMVGFALLLLPFAMMKYESPFTLFMCGGFMLVGVAPNYKGDEDKLHRYAAYISALCSIVWIGFVSPWSFFPMLMWAVPVYFDRDRWLLYLEIALIQGVITSLV